MIRSLAEDASPLLNQPYIRRVRRNHGLEHATVHVLSSRINNLSVAGRSDGGGFWLMGNIPTEQVSQAVTDALNRMRAGEHQLAVHPNCGTSLLTTGTLVALAALTASIGVRRGILDYAGRLPSVVLMSILAIIFSRPLGLQLQQHFTTLGDPGDLQVMNVERHEMRGPRGGQMIMHRVTTQSS